MSNGRDDDDNDNDNASTPNASTKPAIVQDDGLSWEAPLATLRLQQHLATSPNLSDPGYIRQKAAGKLWVRERIALLLDKGSFVEVGSITGSPVYEANKDGKEEEGRIKGFVPANAITGWGKINARKVFVTADDFSVRGGHADGGIFVKAPYGETLAYKARVPLIRLLDGSSGGGSVLTMEKMGSTYVPPMAGLGRSMDALSIVPVCSALLGPVVGLGAAKAVISHFVVMVKSLSQLFAAGPPLVSQATFESHTKESLGGHLVHSTNGTIDNLALSEVDALSQIRTFLSYLPTSVFEVAKRKEGWEKWDGRERRDGRLVSVVPRRRGRMFEVREVVRMVVDLEEGDGGKEGGGERKSSFFEIGATWGRCIVTGFARMAGYPVGVLTSDCQVNGGAIDALGCQKTARFVNLCDQFGIPILNLVDMPGFAIGSQAERLATIRHGATAMQALYKRKTPIYTVILRRAFGVAGGAFADPDDGAGMRVAWPSGDWGSLPLEGGVEAGFKRQLDKASSPAERQEMVDRILERFEGFRSPLKTAHGFGVEEIIDPRDTRLLLCEWVEHVYEHVLPQMCIARQAEFAYGKVASNLTTRL